MSARLLNPRISILTLILELRYTISRCQADPLAAFGVPIFQPLRDECTVVLQQELTFQEALSNAQAAVDIADENLDDFASRLSKAILIITKDDRTHSLYIHFFNKKPLSIFIRPKLNAQLTAMRPWLDTLTASTFPTLKAMTAELSDLIAAADKALGERADTLAQISTFRDVGARRQLFDNVNAARKAFDGDLTKLVIGNPGLSSDYASRVFRSTPGEAGQEDPTIASVTQNITDLGAQLAEAKVLLGKLEEADEAEKKEAAAKLADEAALAELEKQGDDIEKQKEALRAKLGKK